MMPTLKLYILCSCLLLCAFKLPFDGSATQNPARLREQFDEILKQTSSPEFELLQHQHQEIVKRGYTSVTMDILREDSLSAIISFLKYQLHKAFSLSHTQLVRVIPLPTQVIAIPIVLDYPSGFIIIETGQNKIYRRVEDDARTDPWQEETR